MKETQDEQPPIGMRTFLWVAGLLVGLQIIFWWAIKWCYPTLESRGQFGDTFGAINATFSGIALAGVIVTILMQRQELRFQREELELQRKELKRSAKAQEGTARALDEQLEVLRTQKSREHLHDLTRFLPVFTVDGKTTVDSESVPKKRLPAFKVKPEDYPIWEPRVRSPDNRFRIHSNPVVKAQNNFLLVLVTSDQEEERLEISFTDRLGRRIHQDFTLNMRLNSLIPGKISEQSIEPPPLSQPFGKSGTEAEH